MIFTFTIHKVHTIIHTYIHTYIHLVGKLLLDREVTTRKKMLKEEVKIRSEMLSAQLLKLKKANDELKKVTIMYVCMYVYMNMYVCVCLYIHLLKSLPRKCMCGGVYQILVT